MAKKKKTRKAAEAADVFPIPPGRATLGEWLAASRPTTTADFYNLGHGAR